MNMNQTIFIEWYCPNSRNHLHIFLIDIWYYISLCHAHFIFLSMNGGHMWQIICQIFFIIIDKETCFKFTVYLTYISLLNNQLHVRCMIIYWLEFGLYMPIKNTWSPYIRCLEFPFLGLSVYMYAQLSKERKNGVRK